MDRNGLGGSDAAQDDLGQRCCCGQAFRRLRQGWKCSGGCCAKALEGALLAMLGYGILGIVLLVMLIRAKWRRAGVRLFIAAVLLAVGLPLVSQGWRPGSCVGWKPVKWRARCPILRAGCCF